MGRAGIEQLLYAFDRSLEGDPATPPGNWDAPAVNAREGHRLFGACIEGLTDDEQLFERRLGPQGELQEARWLIATMYRAQPLHPGEINHIRALRQGDDRWWQRTERVAEQEEEVAHDSGG